MAYSAKLVNSLFGYSMAKKENPNKLLTRLDKMREVLMMVKVLQDLD